MSQVSNDQIGNRMTPAEHLTLRKVDWILRKAASARGTAELMVKGSKEGLLATLIADALESAAASEVRELTHEALGRYLRRTAGEAHPPYEVYEMLREAYGLPEGVFGLKRTSVSTKLGNP
jgi:hypothetical protein